LQQIIKKATPLLKEGNVSK